MSDEAVLQVVQNFLGMSEAQIAQLDQQVLLAAPKSLERHLLYALRVSRCVPRLRSLETLVSRWRVARCGAGSMGLDAAKNSPHGATVWNFLSKLYADKFCELAEQTVTTAMGKAGKQKGDAMRQKVLDKALATLADARSAFGSDLPDLDEEIHTYTGRIEEFRKS